MMNACVSVKCSSSKILKYSTPEWLVNHLWYYLEQCSINTPVIDCKSATYSSTKVLDLVISQVFKYSSFQLLLCSMIGWAPGILPWTSLKSSAYVLRYSSTMVSAYSSIQILSCWSAVRLAEHQGFCSSSDVARGGIFGAALSSICRGSTWKSREMKKADNVQFGRPPPGPNQVKSGHLLSEKNA